MNQILPGKAMRAWTQFHVTDDGLKSDRYCDTNALHCSDNSARRSDAILERPPSYPSFGPGNTFSFKLKLSAYDGKPHHYRFNCGKSQPAHNLITIDFEGYSQHCGAGSEIAGPVL